MTAAQVQTEYEAAIAKQASHKRASHKGASSSGKTMTVPADGECIDWYWTTIVYDSDGNIISYDEYYLYTTCEGGGSGGSGPPPVDEFIPEFGIPVSDGLSNSTEQNEIIGIDTFKVASRDWKFHEGYTWYGKSKERLVVKSTNGQRTWAGVTHTENIKVGIWLLGDVTIFGTRFTPTVTVGSTSSANMEAKYRIRLTPTGYLKDYESDYLYSYANWNVYFEKTSSTH